jgi:hypothetical protein
MKNSNRLKIALIYLVIAASIACKDDSIRKAARASDDMASTISLAIDVKRQLAMSTPPLIDHDEEVKLTLGLQKVNTSVRAFNTEVKRLSKLDPAAKGNLVALFASVTQSINELNAQGVLGIKNEQSKQKVQAVLAAFSESIAVIQVVLGT